MSSDITVQITCPHCEKTHRFTLSPEGAAGKETGVEHFHEARTPEGIAEKIRELKHKPDERAAALRKRLVDLKDKAEHGRQFPYEDIEKGLLQWQEKAEKKNHAPELSKKSFSRLLNKHLKDRPASDRKPKNSALLDKKIAAVFASRNPAKNAQ